MTIIQNPAVARGLFAKKKKSDTEQALERAGREDELTHTDEPESAEQKLARAAERNDRRTGR